MFLDFVDIFFLFLILRYLHFRFLVFKGPKVRKSGSANGESQLNLACFQSVRDIRKLLESF